MNFEDEQYVRVYTKKTITFRRLGYEGRTVLWHLMIEADRGGVVELGEGDEVEAVTVLLGDLPEELVRTGLSRLSSQGVTVRHGTSLLITRFVEAQEAKRSDRLRAQEYRERERLKNSVNQQDSSRHVTGRHDSSLLASPLPALPCPALPKISGAREPSPTEPKSPDPAALRDPQALATAALRNPTLASFQLPLVQDWPEVVAVADAFAATWGRQDAPRHQGDPRARVILERLAEGYSVAALVAAVRGSRNADYIADNQAHQTLKTILRDAAQVDKFGALTQPREKKRIRAVNAHGREVEESPNLDYEQRQRLAASRQAREQMAEAQAYELEQAEKKRVNGSTGSK